MSGRKRKRFGSKKFVFVCKNPFHCDWGSPDDSKDAGKSCGKKLLSVLSELGGSECKASCRACLVKSKSVEYVRARLSKVNQKEEVIGSCGEHFHGRWLFLFRSSVSGV